MLENLDFSFSVLNKLKLFSTNIISGIGSVNTIVLSPLLFIGRFYLSPFHLKLEKSIEIETQDKQTIIKGRIDFLLLNQKFWVTVIESKQIGVLLLNSEFYYNYLPNLLGIPSQPPGIVALVFSPPQVQQ